MRYGTYLSTLQRELGTLGAKNKELILKLINKLWTLDNYVDGESIALVELHNFEFESVEILKYNNNIYLEYRDYDDDDTYETHIEIL